ncbi:MAG: phosphatidylserine/phosphatidylglycerophosphate/cardiolipin synthase family protein [Armatimonadetes bacterium]|nr:phosphatidylserine/phosphatidylglycerophosphate/cardiolipin synthase family protein [Armatimonadota bacterium]
MKIKNLSPLKINYPLNLLKEESALKEEIGKTSKGNFVKPLISGEIYPEIKEMLDKAKKNIEIDNFIISKWDLAQKLAEAAHRGVKVRVIAGPFNGSGNIKQILNVLLIRRYLRENKVELLNYNLKSLKPRFYNIDHAKTLIVDDKKAMIGGMCWTSDLDKNHDVEIVFKGPAVKNLEEIFNEDWKLAGGKIHQNIPIFEESKTNLEELAPETGYLTNPTEIRVVTTDGKHQDIKKSILEHIAQAKEEILLEIFTLTHLEVIEALIKAKKRGVNIKIILDPNIFAFGSPNKSTAWKLKEAGIETRFYKTNNKIHELMHTKLGLFDGNETVLGSANWTEGSLEYYHEIDAEIKDKTLADSFKKMFEKDWENSLDISPESFLDKISMNIIDKITKIFASYQER